MSRIYKKWLKRVYKKIDNILGEYLPVFMLLIIINLNFPNISVAKGTEPVPQLPLLAGRIELLSSQTTEEVFESENSEINLPDINLREPQYIIKVAVTAYNSHISQTDSAPCITASGFDLCQHNEEDIVATNYLYLPFGSKVRFPDLFGDKVFTVQDRMNARYNRTFDLWFKDYDQARHFGRKWTRVEILPFVR